MISTFPHAETFFACGNIIYFPKEVGGCEKLNGILFYGQFTWTVLRLTRILPGLAGLVVDQSYFLSILVFPIGVLDYHFCASFPAVLWSNYLASQAGIWIQKSLSQDTHVCDIVINAI